MKGQTYLLLGNDAVFGKVSIIREAGNRISDRYLVLQIRYTET